MQERVFYLRLSTKPLDPTMFRGKEDRPIYERLSSALGKLQGEAREAFLYGLRRALLSAQAVVNGENRKTREISSETDVLVQEKDSVPKNVMGLVLFLDHAQIEKLRGVSSGYRDIYRVMVDATRASLPK